jgi:hypothetical protein
MEYYVYKHIRLKDGSIFYIGKGKGGRMYSVDARNQYWKRIVDKDGGFTAKLVQDNLTDEDALLLEKKIISEIGIENLTNMTEGGAGGDTRKGFTKSEYDEWIKRKSEAQTGKVGYWSGKKRPNHSQLIKKARENGVYSNVDYSKPKSEEHKQSLKEAALNRKRNKVVCNVCGIEIVDTHLKVHQRGKNCKQI